MCACVCAFVATTWWQNLLYRLFFGSNRRHQMMSKIFFTPKAFSIKKVFCKLQFFFADNTTTTNNNNKQVFRSIFLLLRPSTNSSLAKRTCQLLICPFRFFFASSIGGEAKEKPERQWRRSQKALFAKRKTQRSCQFLMRPRQLVSGSTGLGDSL